MSNIGFGIAAAALSSLVGPLAHAAERHGYSSFWVNDTPGSDGIIALERAAAETDSIRLGVGVIPIDRRPAESIVRDIERSKLPTDRLVVGIGSGSQLYGSLDAVADAIAYMRDHGDFTIVVGALGPKMVALGAAKADGVVLNWLTPRQAKLSAEEIRRDQGEGRNTEIIAYVRVALPDGYEQLAGEGDRYGSFPAYARHFARMSARPLDTCVYGDRRKIADGLGRFRTEVDETVVRAITNSETLDAYMGILLAAKGIS